ncbi:MAG TPA: hypothetical protein VK691_02030 [Solirubrobacteraceae bacterium]|jgi:hypothetical protein|nr:hypothetical protein [Solirubrobacteraceae bacterium]
MFRNSLLSGIVPRAIAYRLVAGLLGMSFAVLIPASAQATNLFTLGSKASTNAIVTEASGTGYASWVQTNPADEQEVVFCKIPRGGTCTAPIALPLPAGTFEEIVQPFPVLGSHAGVVYVVGPRYDKDEDTLIWTSTDGGEKFSVAKKIPQNTLDKGGIGDVLLDPNTPPSLSTEDDYFGIAGNNVGLGFGFTANNITGGTTAISFEHPGAGGVASSTLGYATHTVEDSGTKKQFYPEIEAYYNLSAPAPETFFYRYYANKGIADDNEGGWEGPIKVSNGYVPRLAGGPAGLFMLSTDIPEGESLESQPSAVDVRKFNETTHTFGKPVQIAKIPTSAGTLFNSGDIYENPETGALYVAQPVIDGAGEYVMRLWESTNGGESFTGERDIATIGFGYSEIPRLAVAADGQGWLTFNDYQGTEVANLNALPAHVLPPPPPPPPPPPAVSSLTIPSQTDQVNGKGDLSVVVDCSSVKCTGDLELLAKFKKTTGKGKKKKTRIVVQTIGTASFNSLALGVDTLSIKLNNHGKSLLAIGGYKLSSTASASYLSGGVFKTATGTVKLKGHKPSKKGVLKKI